jgi:outer membrane protein OmpA-like peptidoglycan-associated protein
MKYRLVLVVATLLLISGTGIFAQEASPTPSSGVAFWVAYWGQPRVHLFGPEQDDFNKGVQEILFPYDKASEPSDPNVLDSNVQFLKNHPNERFYVDAYASSRGDIIYNLVLSQKRAEWVKQALISRGIPESRIAAAVGWGELYPVCPELNDQCWSQNRRVRLVYSPN